MKRARRVVFSLALAFATHTTLVRADPATATAPRRVVAITVAGPGDEARLLEGTVRELLARMQLTTLKESAPSSILASVDVDLQDARGAHLVVRSPTGATVIDRIVPKNDNPAIQREQIALAIRGAAEAELLVDEDRARGRAPPVPPPAAVVVAPAPAPPAPAPPPAAELAPAPVVAEKPVEPVESTNGSFAVDLSTVAGAGLLADDTGPVARVGGAIAVASRKGLGPSVGVLALYAFPFETGNDTLSSRTSLFSIRGLVSITPLRTSRFVLETGVGGGVDRLGVDPRSDTLPASALGPATARVDGLFSAAVTGRLALAPDVALTLSALADVDPQSRSYVFDDRGRRSEVLGPWNLRPTLLAGLSFTALGASAFAR